MGDPFSLATGIAGLINLGLEVTKATRQYVQGVRNAAKDVNEFLNEVSALVDVLHQLVEFLKSDRVGKTNFDQTSVLLLTHSACEGKLKAIRLKLLKRSNDHRLIKALTWPFVKKEHRQTVASLHQWVQTFQFALTIDGCQLLSKAAGDVTSTLRSQLRTLEETRKISQAIPALQQGTQEASTWIKAILELVKSFPATSEDIFNVKENVETLKRLALDDQLHKIQKTHSREKQQLFEWLSPLNFRPKQLDILSRRSPSTGEWLLEDENFQLWLHKKGPTCMWCSGIPGAGKTVLTSIVVDHIQSNPPLANTAAAYIYFDYKNKDTQNVLSVLCNVLRQLLEQVGKVPEEIQQFYDSQPSERKENNLNVDQCFAFMQTVCTAFNRVFLIFDALDECPVYDNNSNELRSKMVSTIQKASHLGSVFITSRPHVNLSQELNDCACLEVRATDSDMCAYLKARTADHRILRRIVDHSPALETHLIDTICSKANGMFLLARLQMDSLVNQTSARNIYRALKYLPEKLNDTFNDAMKRVAAQPVEHSTLAAQVISWIFYAKRPLSVAELREALSIELGDTRLDRSGCHEVELSLDVCCGLVSIDEEDNVIRLVHYSLQQYLEDNWKIHNPRSKWGIAATCLTYLMLDDFSPLAREDIDGSMVKTGDGSLSNRARWQDSHRFFSYVASYWAEHVKGSLEKELEPLILRFFHSKVHLLYGLQEYNKLKFRNLEYDTWPHEPSSLHLTAYWGLAHITRTLVKQGADVHVEDAQKRTPLVCAALNGHGEVARVLLREGSDVNARDSAAATPLHAAVINDHVDIARLLLKFKPDANAKDKDGSSPMCLAASNGNLQMMDLLLQMGASADNIGKGGVSPLEIASRGGHAAAVQWLLVKGVDVNSENSSPLTEAVYANQPHVVRILLDAGVNINKVNEFGYTALGTAVKKGNLNIAQRLVTAGANVNTSGKSFADESPLQMAAFEGNEALVTLLLSHGADVRAQGGDLGTVLQMAIHSRNLNIVNNVLRAFPSPDVNLGKGNFGTTPLQLAVLLKDFEILSQLLSHLPDLAQQDGKADTNKTTSFGITPLHQAVYLGWESGIDALVRHGANPQTFDLYGQTCLDWAFQDEDLFRRLRGQKSYRPTSHVTQQRHLKETVRNLLVTLLQNSDRQDGRRINYHYLGHCLLRLKDVEEARTSFEQQIKNVFSKHEPRHNILCHRCEDEDIFGSRFVCHTCADIDICNSHMSQYESKPPDPRCKKHRFLEVPGPLWKDFGNGKVNEVGETIDEWLARLLLRYGGVTPSDPCTIRQ